MDMKTKHQLFSGSELGKLQDFCNQCAYEDKKIHEKRQNGEEYVEPPAEINPPKPKKQPPKYNINEYINEYDAPTTTNNSQYTYEEIGIKKQNLSENDPDPFNARIKSDTFDQRLKQFGGNK